MDPGSIAQCAHPGEQARLYLYGTRLMRRDLCTQCESLPFANDSGHTADHIMMKVSQTCARLISRYQYQYLVQKSTLCLEGPDQDGSSRTPARLQRRVRQTRSERDPHRRQMGLCMLGRWPPMRGMLAATI